jgi:hypothetical protein
MYHDVKGYGGRTGESVTTNLRPRRLTDWGGTMADLCNPVVILTKQIMGLSEQIDEYEVLCWINRRTGLGLTNYSYRLRGSSSPRVFSHVTLQLQTVAVT